ncbi:MAG TPA: TetR/AcrR family transcriptional regulator [Deltaproteobacteria bacterium]|nr:TetR/AcrR family transcriptional regulator [Deltaproteobacteria bacterium]
MEAISNQNIPKKKTHIVEAAEALFIRHGIKRITVEEICRSSGASKMTFYKYFPNKLELVKYIWINWMEEGLAKMDEIDSMEIPFPEKTHRMFLCKADLVSKMSTEFIEEILPIEFEVEKIERRFLAFIIAAQRKGEIRPNIKPEFIMAAWDKLLDLAEDDHLRQKYPDFLEFQRDLKDFFWFGALTGKYASI